MKQFKTLIVILLITCFGASSSYAADAVFNGTYSIIASHSGKALDTWAWGTTDGTNIAQYDYWGGDAQKFIVTPVDGIWHKISPVISTSQAFDVADGSVDSGANIQTYNYWGHACQQFRFEDAGNGMYYIINRNSDMCLDVDGFSQDDGANVMQWTCLGGTNQMFTMIQHGDSAETTMPSCMEGIDDFDSAGPFSYTYRSVGNVKFYVPNVPSGCKVPVVHHANGTTATCSMYDSVLQRLASHGFVTACYESPDTGAGTQCIEAVETAFSSYSGIVDTSKVGFTGHSQGGSATFMCTLNAENKWGTSKVFAGLAQEPASGYGVGPATTSNFPSYWVQVDSPMMMFNGTADTLVPQYWVRNAYNALNSDVEAYWYTGNGATHIPVPNAYTNDLAPAWFRWKLLGDQDACDYIKSLPRNSVSWSFQNSQNEESCN